MRKQPDKAKGGKKTLPPESPSPRELLRRYAPALGVLLMLLLTAAGYSLYLEGQATQAALERQAANQKMALERVRQQEQEAKEKARQSARAQELARQLAPTPEPTPEPEKPPCGALSGPCPGDSTCTSEGHCVKRDMVYVPAGDFQMGCDPSTGQPCAADEQPLHRVKLSSYGIDRLEVSVEQYRACLGARECTAPKNTISSAPCNYDMEGRDAYPMTCVTWRQARNYCLHVQKRLPTEAEWEKAARGVDERRYPWGNEPASCEWANIFFKLRGCRGGSSPVGDYPQSASPYGALDMIGNALEWVYDYYDQNAYYSEAEENPAGPMAGSHHVLRGSSFGAVVQAGHSVSVRYNMSADTSSHLIGFRCAVSTW